MIRHLARVRAIVLPLAVAFLLASCGGSSGATSAGATGGVKSNPSAPASPAASASQASSQGAGQFCAVVKQQIGALQGTDLAKLLSGSAAEAWKAYLDKTAQMNRQLVDASPADIKQAVTKLQESTQQLAETMKAGEYDPAQVGSAKIIAAMQSKDRATASSRLTSYVKTNCGIDLTKPAG